MHCEHDEREAIHFILRGTNTGSGSSIQLNVILYFVFPAAIFQSIVAFLVKMPLRLVGTLYLEIFTVIYFHCFACLKSCVTRNFKCSVLLSCSWQIQSNIPLNLMFLITQLLKQAKP